MNSLTIRISREHIIFCTYDRLANLLPEYEVYNNDPDVSLNANIHKAIKNSPLAQRSYNFVNAYTLEPITLVPLKEFEEEDINDIYFFNYPSLKMSSKVFYDTLPYLNALLLFSVEKGVCHSLREFYPNIQFHSPFASLILQYASRYPFSSTESRLYCYVNESRLTTVVIKGGQLEFLNGYQLHNTSDALFYIASIAQRLELKPNAESIYVGGDRLEAESITHSLEKIGFRGFYMLDSEELSQHPIAGIKEFPYDLKVLLLKAY